MPYLTLVLPLASLALSQVVKSFIPSNHQKLSLKSMFTYSGMPSTHSALVTSLVTIVALQDGINSPLFAVSLILAIIVIRDATGLRWYLGEHSKVINILIKDLGNDDVLEHKYPHLLEKIGHTPAQVTVGALLGLIVSMFGWIFLR